MNTNRCGLLKDRQRLRERLHSHKFQMVIIAMVGLDFLIVLVMLLIDIEVIRGGKSSLQFISQNFPHQQC